MYQAAVAAKTAFVLRIDAPRSALGLPRPRIQG
jgi:hypothetical protein